MNKSITKLKGFTYQNYLKERERIFAIQKKLYISKDAVRPAFIKGFFVENKKYFKTAICAIYNKKKSNCLSLEYKPLQNILRAAIRYFYDEQEYNRHLGGDGLRNIFVKNNEIFKCPITNVGIGEMIEDSIQSENFIKNPSKGVSLYYGHAPYGIRWAFVSVRNSLENGLSLAEVKRRGKWIKKDIQLCKIVLRNGKFFRARSGYNTKKYLLVESEKYFSKGKVPYGSKKDLKMPLCYKARAGRCNKKGIPFFYLASDMKTGIAECKVKLATYISIGRFKRKRKINIIDASKLDYYDFAKNDNLIKTYIWLRDVQDLFAIPVNEQNKKDYLKSQYVARIIRRLGYKGLMYKSSVSSGKNYVFFNDNNFNFVEGSAKLIKVKKIEYSITEIKNKLCKDRETGINSLQEIESPLKR